MSLHKQPGKPNWFCAYTQYEAETGTSTRVFRSTGTPNKKQAEAICQAWQKAQWHARHGTLSVDVARAIIAEGVADAFRHANQEEMPSTSIRAWLDGWLETTAKVNAATTHARYKTIIDRFAEFLGDAKCNRDLATLPASDIALFRDHEAKERATATANLAVKVLGACLAEAVRQGLLTVNPALRLNILHSSDESKR